MGLPNRLQKNWGAMVPRILNHWTELTESDLVSVEGEFDRLVEVIRERSKPGRSHITVEAKIRDWLLQTLSAIELH